MSALVQLLASHSSILVLDAASSTVQVGLLRVGAAPIWHRSKEEAGQAVFPLVDSCLTQSGREMTEIKAFIYCEGPGSMLGIRTVAMAIRTWMAERPRPAYYYQSLTLLAYELRRTGQIPPFSVIADARRDTWHCVTVGDDVSPLLRVPTAELAGGTEPLWQPAAFRAFVPAPRPTQDCSYDASTLLAAHDGVDLFTATDAPDAFQHSVPEYKKWSPQVHRAPS